MVTTVAIAGAQVTRAQADPTPVARFEFSQTQGRQAGVWLVRQGPVRFSLPITTGVRSGVADSLPAPHDLPGFATPVDQVVPALTPFLDLDDGRTIVAADGADEIVPAPDGRTLRARWTRWVQLGAKSGELIDPGLDTEVEWRLEKTGLVRVERLTARRSLTIRRWRVVVPSASTCWLTYTAGTLRIDVLDGKDGVLEVSVLQADWPYGTGRSSMGGGQYLNFAAENIKLAAGETKGWTLRLEVRGGHAD